MGALVALVLALGAPAARAQLDPLLFIKRVPPTVIVVMDTSFRMLEDGDGSYYDTNTYAVMEDQIVATELLGPGVITATHYRRKYQDLQWESNPVADSSRWEADGINAVPNTSPSYGDFWQATRYEIAKRGVAQAVDENRGSRYRWGLVRLRQDGPAWQTPANDCGPRVRPVRVDGLLEKDRTPCDATGSEKRFVLYPPRVNSPSYGLTSGGNPVVVAAGDNTAEDIHQILSRPILDATGLIPASRGALEYEDRPLKFALDDARAEAVRAMSADLDSCRSCRNTVVVLVTGGKDDGDATYLNNNDVEATASTFLNVSAGGVSRRVPIYVVGVKPDPNHKAQLETIAANSGGRYFDATTAADVTRAVNLAVQAGFSNASDFDLSQTSEFQPVSPIVGTVDLRNAKDATGATLPHTDILTPTGQDVPQRSNFLLTSGFALPGFDGRLRAFRTYRPEEDSTRPSGWKFVNDGTRLWPNVDGRPETAGLARTPADPSTRNVYTWIPGSGVVAFTEANAGLIEAHLGGATAADVIPFVREQPLGAVIGSTPAIMDPPSLDPPPDEAYGRIDVEGTFADDLKNRRATIWFGGNNGMIHGVDARTGFEVWAFIPYNLLPKLRTLLDGQPVEQFDYFVDSSPKIAEVKVNDEWRSLLIIGQSWGGTFYQTFDVTEAGLGGPAPDSDDWAGVLSSFASPTRVRFMWSFPDYTNFDPNYTETFTVTDGTSGGRLKLYGDLRDSATPAEKSVGFSWSDPAVGPLNSDRSVNVLIVGSGYFPSVEDLIPSRGSTAPRAGRSLYLVRVEDGKLLGNASGGACSTSSSGTGCLDVGDVTSNAVKNALQTDPTAAGDYSGAPYVTKAYMGDLDGIYWRFDFTDTGTITKSQMTSTGQPIYSSSALLYVGSSDQYMFFSTGSDLLPSSSPGGTGTFKLIGLKDNFPGSGATTSFSRNLTTVTNSNGLATGERPSTSPSVAGDIVFYTTTTENASVPCEDFSAKLYALTFLGGAAYDTDGSGTISNNESPVVRTVAGRATAPFIVDQHLYFGTAGTGGSNVEVFGDPEDFNNGVGQVGVRILSWRELR